MSHKLLVKDSNGEREVLLIDTVAIGRDPRCDISSNDPLLSRRHAEFIASDAGVMVRDLGSRNGILVNGRRIPEAALNPGDVVQVSQVLITYLSSIQPRTMVLNRAAAPSADPPVDDETSLLNQQQIEAVAAASSARANGTANGNGRRSAAWSVQLVAEDDRTKMVPPPADALMFKAAPASGAGADSSAATLAGDTPIRPLPATPVVVPVEPQPAPPSIVPIWVSSIVLALACVALGIGAAFVLIQSSAGSGTVSAGGLAAVSAAFLLAAAGGAALAAAAHRTVRRAAAQGRD